MYSGGKNHQGAAYIVVERISWVGDVKWCCVVVERISFVLCSDVKKSAGCFAVLGRIIWVLFS